MPCPIRKRCNGLALMNFALLGKIASRAGDAVGKVDDGIVLVGAVKAGVVLDVGNRRVHAWESVPAWPPPTA